MTNSHSDALVFFGATGDLAYKKIFPALQAMLKRGHLNVPVVGVAKAGWTLDQLGRPDRVDAAAVARFASACERAEGGFRGGLWDEGWDVEYTFYGLGVLALFAE